MTGKGDIKLTGLIPLYDGTASFEWTGEEGGKLLSVDSVTVITVDAANSLDATGENENIVRPLWARRLIVKGAAQIGEEGKPFYAWIISRVTNPSQQIAMEPDDVLVAAKGDIYMDLASVQFYVIDDLDAAYEANKNMPVPVLDLNSIQSETGDVYLALEDGRSLYSTDGATVTIPLPGSLEYDATSQVSLVNDYTITGLDMLSYYEVARDPETGISTYLLPNGTTFYMDGEGNVSRIEEAGTSMAVGEYVFKSDAQGVYEIQLNAGVSINLRTGELDVAEDTSFEVLLQAIKGTWLDTRGLFSNLIKVRISLEDGSDKDFRVMKMPQAWNDMLWYYMNLLQPSVWKDQTANNFVIAYDQKNDQVHFYRVGKVETQESLTNDDYFVNLDGDFAEEGGNYRTSYTKTDAFFGRGGKKLNVSSLLRKDHREGVYEYYFDAEGENSFLDCGYEVRAISNDHSYGNSHAYSYQWKDGDVWRDLEIADTGTNMGVTVKAGHSEQIYKNLEGKYWLPEHTTGLLSEAVGYTGGSASGKSKTLEANAGDGVYRFTEPRHHARVWTPKLWYSWPTIDVTAHEEHLIIHKLALEEVSAFLSNEGYDTVDYYIPTTYDDQNNTEVHLVGERDESGELIRDEANNVVGEARKVYVEYNADNVTIKRLYEYVTDENGTVLKDAQGNKLTRDVQVSEDYHEDYEHTRLYTLTLDGGKYHLIETEEKEEQYEEQRLDTPAPGTDTGVWPYLEGTSGAFRMNTPADSRNGVDYYRYFVVNDDYETVGSRYVGDYYVAVEGETVKVVEYIPDEYSPLSGAEEKDSYVLALDHGDYSEKVFARSEADITVSGSTVSGERFDADEETAYLRQSGTLYQRIETPTVDWNQTNTAPNLNGYSATANQSVTVTDGHGTTSTLSGTLYERTTEADPESGEEASYSAYLKVGNKYYQRVEGVDVSWEAVENPEGVDLYGFERENDRSVEDELTGDLFTSEDATYLRTADTVYQMTLVRCNVDRWRAESELPESFEGYTETANQTVTVTAEDGSTSEVVGTLYANEEGEQYLITPEVKDEFGAVTAPSAAYKLRSEEETREDWAKTENTRLDSEELLWMYANSTRFQTREADGKTVYVLDENEEPIPVRENGQIVVDKVGVGGPEAEGRWVLRTDWKDMLSGRNAGTALSYYAVVDGVLTEDAEKSYGVFLTTANGEGEDASVTLFKANHYDDISEALTKTERVITYVRDYYDVTFSDGKTARLRYDDFCSEAVPSAGNSNSLVLRFGDAKDREDDEPQKPTMTINGAISGIKLNTISLPDTKGVTGSSDRPSYQISETLYLTKSGLVVNVVRQGSTTVFASRYNGSVYLSTKIKAEQLKGAIHSTADALGNQLTPDNGKPVFTIRAGELIWRELRTDVIATDRNGDYWYKDPNSTTWQKAAASISRPSSTNASVRRDGVGSVKVGNKEYLKIAYEDELDEAGQKTGRKVLYYYMPVNNGQIRAGSDGTVTVIKGDPFTQRILMDTKGTSFMFHTVAAANDVEIWLYGEKDSILDGDRGTDDVDIKAGGLVTIYSDSRGSIGSSETDRLEIEAEKQEMFDLNRARVIRTDAFIYESEGDVHMDGSVVVDGAEWNLATNNGSVIFSKPADDELTFNLTVENGGKAIITTNVNRDLTQNTGATSDGDVRINEVKAYGTVNGRESQLILNVDGSVEINTLQLGESGESAGGRMTAEIGGGLTVNGTAVMENGSTATVHLGDSPDFVGDATFTGAVTMDTGATLNLKSEDGGLTAESDVTMIGDSTATVEVMNDVALSETLSMSASTLDVLSHEGGMSVEADVTMSDKSKTTVEVKNDVAFHEDAAVTASSLSILSHEGDMSVRDSLRANDGSTVKAVLEKGSFTLADYEKDGARVDTVLETDDSLLSVNAKGNIAVSHLDGAGSVGSFIAGGSYTGKTVALDASAVEVNAYEGVTVVSDENDDGTGKRSVIRLSDSLSSRLVSVTDQVTGTVTKVKAGLTVISDNGGLDSAGGEDNYYDSWRLDNAELTALVKGDVAIRDTLSMNGSVGTIQSTAGSFFLRDYSIDGALRTGGMSLNDSSVLSVLVRENVSLDRLKETGSALDMTAQTGSIGSKTWEILSSALVADAEKNVTVTNPGDLSDRPAVSVTGSEHADSFVHPNSVEGEEKTVARMGLYVNAHNGSVSFITRNAAGEDINSLDFSAVDSNVDIDARDHVTILEGSLKDADVNIKSSGETENRSLPESPAPSTLRPRLLTRSRGDQPDSLVSMANWIVSDNSTLNVTALGDINVLYNLNGVEATARIAERELKIVNASHVSLTSTEGGVYILRDYDEPDSFSTLAYAEGDYVGDNIYEPDVWIAGGEHERTRDEAIGERSTLTVSGAKNVKVASILSDFADLSLRSTAENLLFDVIRGEETNLRLAAGQNIDALHPQLSPVIRFHDRAYDADETPIDTPKNASLTLSAGLDIGNREHQLYVDVPEELTVRIERVRNLFLTALDIDEAGVPEPLTWNNDSLSFDEEEGAIAVDGEVFRLGYSESDGAYLAGELESRDGEELYRLVIPELSEENMADWLLARSRAVYDESAAHGWINLLEEGVDLEARLLAPYQELVDGLNEEFRLLDEERQRALEEAAQDGEAPAEPLVYEPDEEELARRAQLVEDTIAAYTEAEFGSEFAAAALSAIESCEVQSVQEFVVFASLTPSGAVEDEALAALCDAAGEKLYRGLFEEGKINSYTDEDGVKTRLTRWVELVDENSGEAALVERTDRAGQILRLIARDFTYSTQLAAQLREAIDSLEDETVAVTETLDDWLLEKSESVYGESENVAWTYLVPGTREELEALILAPYTEIEEKLAEEFALLDEQMQQELEEAAQPGEMPVYEPDEEELSRRTQLVSDTLAEAVEAEFGSEFLAAAQAAVENGEAGSVQQFVVLAALTRTAALEDEAQAALYDAASETVYRRLYADGRMTAYTEANGEKSEIGLKELIRRFNEGDGAYAESLVYAAAIDDASYLPNLGGNHSRISKAKLEADRYLNEVEVGVAENTAARAEILDEIRALNEAELTQQVEKERLEAFEARLAALEEQSEALAAQIAADEEQDEALARELEENRTQQAQLSAAIKTQKTKVESERAAAARQAKLEELSEQLAQTDAAIANGRREFIAAQVRLDDLNEAILRTESFQAAYTREGSVRAENGNWENKAEKAAWQLGAENAAAAAAEALDAGDIAAAHEKLLTALGQLESADAFSQSSLEKAIALSQTLRSLADAVADSAFVTDAAEAYEAADAQYQQKYKAMIEAQRALDDVAEEEKTLQAARYETEEDRQQALEDWAQRLAAAQLAAAEAASAAEESGEALAAANAALQEAELVLSEARGAAITANRLGYQLSSTTLDTEARDLNLLIGEAVEGGELNVRNVGSINLTIDSGMETPDTVALKDSDATIGTVNSERGDVSITNKSGSLFAGENSYEELGDNVYLEENIHGRAISLAARDAIGAADKTFLVEETAHESKPVLTAYVVSPYGEEGVTDAGVFVDADGNTVRTDNKPIGSRYLDDITGATPAERAANTAVSTEVSALDAGRLGGGTASGEELASTVAIRKDTLRVYDQSAATELNATAGNGGIYLTERTGSIGAGEIRAAGDVVLTAINGADAKVADAEQRSTVAVGGVMTVNTVGDVSLIAEGDLSLKLNTEANHVDITTDAEKGEGDITVVSESSETLTGSALSNGSVTLINGGDIGTEDVAFAIHSVFDSGDVTIKGNSIYVENAEGGVTVNSIQARGDLELSVGGDIADAGSTGLGDTVDQVTDAQDAQIEAERELTERKHERDEAKELKKLADAALERAAEARDEAQEALTEAQTALDEASAAKQEADNAKQLADEAKAAADQALTDAEAALAGALANLDESDPQSVQALADAQAALAEAQTAAEQAETDAAAAQSEVDKAQSSVDEAQAAVDAGQELFDAADAAFNEAQQAADEANAVYEAAEAAVAAADTTEQRMAEKQQHAEDVLDAQRDYLKTRDELAAMPEAVQQAQEKRQEAEQSFREAELALTEAEQTLTEAEQTFAEAEHTLNEAQAACAALAEDENADEQALAEAEAAAAEAEAALAEAEAAKNEAQNAKDEAEAVKTEAEGALEEAESELQSLEKHQSDLEILLPALENQLGAEEQLYHAYQTYVALAEDETSDPDELAAAEKAVETARRALEETQTALAIIEALHDAEQAYNEALEAKAEPEQALADATDAKNEADEAKRLADEAKAAADQAVTGAQAALDAALASLDESDAESVQAAADAQTALEEAQAAAAEAGAEAEQAQTAAEQAQAAFEEAEAALVEPQRAYDEAVAALERADAELAMVETMQESLEKAVAAEQNYAGAQAKYEALRDDPDADAEELARAQEAAALAYRAMQNAETELAASKQVIDSALAVDAAAAADKAAQAALEEAQAAEDAAREIERATDVAREYAEAALSEAQNAANEAGNAVSGAEARAANAQNALETATNAELQAARDELAAAQAELRAAEAALTAAQSALSEAQAEAERATAEDNAAKESLQTASDERQSAQDAKDQTAQTLENKRDAFDAAEELFNVTAEAAENARQTEAAAKARNEAEDEAAEVSALVQELAEATNERDAEAANQRSAYDSFLHANTGMDQASQGARDVTDRGAALDRRNNTLSEKEERVQEIKDRLTAVTGTDDPAAATDAAQQKLDEAENAATAAMAAATAAEGRVADTVSAMGSSNIEVRPDPAGTSAVRPETAKSGDAAIEATGNVTIKSEGSVGGQNGQEMTVNADGKLKVEAQDDVKLQSGQDVKLDAITVGGSVGATNHGDLTGVGKDPAITAQDTALNVISTGSEVSEIGKSDGSSLVVKTDVLSLRGDEADIKTPGSVTLGDVSVDTLSLEVNGDISQKPGAELDAQNASLTAAGGIGSEENPIRTNTDTISAKGGDVYLDNRSELLTVEEIIGKDVGINAAGSIDETPDGMITAHNLTITAAYDVGTPTKPLRVLVDGTLSISSRWGETFYVNLYAPAGWRMLVDKVTGLKVVGMFADDARLEVINTAHYALLTYPELQEQVGCVCEDLHLYSEHCEAAAEPVIYSTLIDGAESETRKLLWALVRDGQTLFDFVLGIFSLSEYPCRSSMIFEVSLAGLNSGYDGSLEGETVYVLACVADELVVIPAEVEDGKIGFEMNKLGMDKADYGYTQFVILDEATFASVLA